MTIRSRGGYARMFAAWISAGLPLLAMLALAASLGNAALASPLGKGGGKGKAAGGKAVAGDEALPDAKAAGGGRAGARNGAADKSSLWGVRKERVGPETSGRPGAPRHTFGLAVRRDSFVRYEVIGGDVDGTRTLTIRGDGSMKLSDADGKLMQGQLNAGAMREFIKSFNAFDDLAPVYGEKTADPFQKTTTFVRRVARRPQKSSKGAVVDKERDRARTITVYEMSEQTLPRDLTKLIDGLEKIIATRLTEVTDVEIEFRGIASGCMLDRTRYRLVLEDPPVSTDLWVQVSVANLADEPFVLDFQGGQPLEITIETQPGGEVVYQWSKGQQFPERAAQVKLVRDTQSWVERVPLRDAAGVAFPAGHYILRYDVRSVPAFRGSVEFEIVGEEPRAKKEELQTLLAEYKRSMQKNAAAAGGAAKGKSGSKAKASGKVAANTGGAAKSKAGGKGGGKAKGKGGGKKNAKM